MAIPGFDLPPGHWARVRGIAEQLATGTAPRADGRTLLAAAILAGSQGGASAGTIAQTVQRAVVGRGEVRSARVAPASGSSVHVDAHVLVDALLLSEILAPPPGRGRARSRGPHR